MISLSRLMQHDLDAWVTNEIQFSRFKKDVAHNASRLSGGNVILFEESTYAFAVGMMAALHAGCKISLPPNGHPSTLAKIKGKRLDVVLGQKSDFDLRPLNTQNCILDFYTSGSTGEAKCVRKTLQQIENEVSVLEETWGNAVGKALVLATVSHQHIYGMLFKVFWSLSAGRPFYDKMFEYWEMLAPHLCEASFIVSSPAHLTRYPSLNVPSPPLVIFSSGGALPYGAAQQTQQIFNTIPIEIFGSTETGGIAYRQQKEEMTSWSPFDSVDICSDDDGVLSIRSPYLENNDWYETSDKVEFTPDKRFHLKGRVDRIVKVEGKRVSFAEVEAAAMQSLFVRDAVALIVDDDRQSLSCVIVLTKDGQSMLAEIGAFRMGRLIRSEMRAQLDQAALPRRWRFIEKIPVNSQGKCLMADLLSLY